MSRLGGGFGVSRFCHDVSLIVEAHARASRRGGALHGWRMDRCKGDLTSGEEQGTRHQRCTRWSSASCWPPHWGPRRSQRWQTAHGGPRQSPCHLQGPCVPPCWVRSSYLDAHCRNTFFRRHFLVHHGGKNFSLIPGCMVKNSRKKLLCGGNAAAFSSQMHDRH